jgi:hypothetical protein
MAARRLVRVLAMTGGALVALALAAAVDVGWFDRPAAAHLRHAVHLLQSALHTTDEPNAEVPVLHAMTLRERHETVVQYWLFGYGNDRIIAAYLGGLAIALLVRWKFRSSLGILIWLGGVIALVAVDFRELITAPKWLAGLYRVAPYLVFAVLPSAPAVRRSDGGTETDALLPRVALLATGTYLLVAFAGVDTTGGKGLGPRLLLPLLPVLTVAAIVRIGGYLRAGTALDRWAGLAGVVLLVMTLVMHTYATTRAYYWRNREDSSVILAVAASAERIVVADQMHTAQLLFPLYYRKIIFLADSPDAAVALGSMLTTGRLPGALLVSRNPEPSMTLPGLRVKRIEQIGRMSITHWAR